MPGACSRRYTSKDPTPTDLQRKYIEFSQRTQRTQTIMLGLTVVTLIIMIGLTMYAVDRSNYADQQSLIAKQDRNFAQTKAVEALHSAATATISEGLAKENETRALSAEAEAETATKMRPRPSEALPGPRSIKAGRESYIPAPFLPLTPCKEILLILRMRQKRSCAGTSAFSPSH